MTESLIEVFKIFVFASILFVWVVRYKNIIEEFRAYQYPDWLRDLVGILKLSFAIMLIRENVVIVMVGATGIMSLMLAALITHLKVKSPFPKMLPSLTLFFLCLAIFILTRGTL